MENDILGLNTVTGDLSEELHERVDLVIHKLKFFPDKPKVACITAINPFSLSQNRISQSINLAGGFALENLNGEDIKLQNPAVIIIALNGLNIQDTMAEIHDFISLPNWRDLDAVKNNRVYIADSKNYFESDGPKAVDALEAIAEIITPKYFNFGLEGKAWIKFEM